MAGGQSSGADRDLDPGCLRLLHSNDPRSVPTPSRQALHQPGYSHLLRRALFGNAGLRRSATLLRGHCTAHTCPAACLSDRNAAIPRPRVDLPRAASVRPTAGLLVLSRGNYDGHSGWRRSLPLSSDCRCGVGRYDARDCDAICRWPSAESIHRRASISPLKTTRVRQRGRQRGRRDLISLAGPGPHWGHIRATNDQTAADNCGHQRSGILPPHRPDLARIARHCNRPALSRTEEATGFKPLLLPKATIGHRHAAGRQRRAGSLPRCLSGGPYAGSPPTGERGCQQTT
jgi:hypothetical protein